MRLLLSPRSGALCCPEGNSRAHGLLLHRSCSTAELLRDLTGRRSRLRERLKRLQLTRAPAGAIIGGTFCHYLILRQRIAPTQGRVWNHTPWSDRKSPTNDPVT